MIAWKEGINKVSGNSKDRDRFNSKNKDRFNDKNKSNYPTQAKRRLEWTARLEWPPATE